MEGNKIRLFGFCGRKRSGKGVLSNIVKEQYNGEIVTVANYLKRLCCDILECDLDTLNQQKDDGTIFSIKPDERWYHIIHDKTGVSIEDIKKDISNIEFTNIRQMLQVIGTDCIRKHYPQWHVNCMKDEIKKHLDNGKVVAVDDVRFPNERKAIEELGGTCYFIIRPLCENVSNHISETSLTWDMFDRDKVIINDCSLSDLITSFKIYLNCGYSSRLMSNINASYMEHNLSFGKEETDLVKKIITQNEKLMIKYEGHFGFKSSSIDEFNEFVSEILNEKVNTDAYIEDIMYVIYNPVIVENLKRYL